MAVTVTAQQVGGPVTVTGTKTIPNGGDAGQYLKKTTDADYATEWFDLIDDASSATDQVVSSQETDARIAALIDDTATEETSVWSSSFVDAKLQAVATPNTPNVSGVVSGLGVSYLGLLQFGMAAGSYYIDGVLYTATAQSITLDAADATNPRIDVLYVDEAGVFGKVTGTPAATPSQPTVDTTARLALTFVQVPATATSLSGITTTAIYTDASAWTVTTSGSGWTVDSTNNPYEGTKDIEATSVAAGSYVKFTTSPTFAWSTEGNLVFRLRSKGAWTGKRSLSIQVLTSGGTVGTGVEFRTNTYGFNASETSSYQLIVIPKSNFAVPGSTSVAGFSFTVQGATLPGFYLDDVELQDTGTSTGGGTTVSGITQTDADARYAQRANNLSDLTSAGTSRTNLGLGTVATLASDTDTSLTANSDSRVATQKAVKAYVTSATGGLGALVAANNLSDVVSVSTSRNNLGLGTGDSPQFTALNVGHASDTTITRTGAGDVAVEGNAIYRAGGTDVPVTDGGTGSSTAGGARTNLGLGTISTFDEATAAQFQANTSAKALSTDKVWSAADYVALTDAATVAVDLSTGINFSVTLGGNRTLGNPSNTKNGQSGLIVITQDGTGSRTLAYSSNWKFAGGTAPVLSTTASAVDYLFYQVKDSTHIFGSIVKDVK